MFGNSRLLREDFLYEAFWHHWVKAPKALGQCYLFFCYLFSGSPGFGNPSLCALSVLLTDTLYTLLPHVFYSLNGFSFNGELINYCLRYTCYDCLSVLKSVPQPSAPC